MKKYYIFKIAVCLILLISTIYYSNAQTLPPYVPSNGLVGWWPFNGNANDESGNSNNGTLNNGTLFTTNRFDDASSAVLLDGINDYIALPSGNTTSLNIVGDFTVTFWIKTTDTSGCLLSCGDNISNPPTSAGFLSGINIGYVGNGKISVATRGIWSGSINTVTDNNWHYIAYSLKNDTLRIYIDNMLENQVTSVLTPLSWTGNRVIGCLNDLTMNELGNFIGKFDDLGIWNRALTPHEIANLYNSSISQLPHIVSTDTIICKGDSTILHFYSQSLNDTIVVPATSIPGDNFEYCYTIPTSGWQTNIGGWLIGHLPFVGTTGGAVPGDTYWPLGTSIYVRKQIDLTNYNLNSINWFVAVDNGHTFYVNGTLVASASAGGTAVEWEYSGIIPANLLIQGLNIISFKLDDWGGGGAAVFNTMIKGVPISPIYNWSTNQTSQSITIKPVQTNKYYCTISYGNNNFSDSITIHVNNINVDAGTNVSVCEGDSITLFGSGANTYSWSNNITNGIAFVPTTSSFYSVFGIDSIGCKDKDSVYIEVKHNSSNSISHSICNGFYWTATGQTYTTSGTYTAILTNVAGCDSTVTLNLSGTHAGFNVQPSNQNVNIGNSSYFIANYSDPNSTYYWQTDFGFGFQNVTNAGQYNGANNDTLTLSNATIANNNQIFRCIVTSESCKDTSNIATLTIGNISINELNDKQQSIVFPNPASNEINVKIFSVNIGANYTIIDNLGRIVKKGILNSESSKIEIGNLSGGVYLFRIGNNVKEVFKVMKN